MFFSSVNKMVVVSLLFLILCLGASCVQGMKSDGLLWENEEGFDMEMEMEMQMDSEINRRILWATQKKYISYEALKNDVVPCSRPGAPYYNCRGVSRANPYTRGCGVITRCARDANP
ncbi:hypothetical protein J5N97_019842 [Dioscorea zingiberensis]|uniref:Rapid ALkalinization Factor n=1 Tax=Dioscorea zingiberensis TaxID=325984 RepID=A0A9D5HD90_9LILI|nr:hypothetical protein J5N97_019842 [Dioscorea zingiberensis]